MASAFTAEAVVAARIPVEARILVAARSPVRAEVAHPLPGAVAADSCTLPEADSCCCTA